MYLSAPGMACPVGLSAEAACAAMRAGVAQFEDLPYQDNNGESIVGAMVPGLDPSLSRRERLVKMLSLAVSDSLDKCPPSLRTEQVPIIVCLSEPVRPGGSASLAQDIVGAVERSLGVSFHPDQSCATTDGHTAAFRALQMARRLLAQDGISACLVCGVDSFINAQSLDWLDQSERLKNDEEPDGVIPGEAAAAVLVAASPSDASGHAVRVAGLGFSSEDASVLSNEVMLGIGLATAAQQALADAKITMQDIDFRISDVTGESYGFKEQILAIARLMRTVKAEFPIWHAADTFGDTGAAAGLCQLIMLAFGFGLGYAPGTRALCFTSAVDGARAVAVVERAAS